MSRADLRDARAGPSAAAGPADRPLRRPRACWPARSRASRSGSCGWRIGRPGGTGPGGVAVLAAGPLLGVARRRWSGRAAGDAAAAAVDAHYGLKDRAVTALDFVGRGRADAAARAPGRRRRASTSRRSSPREVVPFRVPARPALRRWPRWPSPLGLLLWPPADAGPGRPGRAARGGRRRGRRRPRRASRSSTSSPRRRTTTSSRSWSRSSARRSRR